MKHSNILLSLSGSLWFLCSNPASVAGLATSPRKQAEPSSESKAGLAWNNADKVDMTQFESTGKVSWYYTWSLWPTEEGDDLEYVPMFWGDKVVDEWNRNMEDGGVLLPRFESGSIKAVLAFNEPNDKGQSNMSPEDAKDLWIEHLEPLKKEYGVRLGSPATSSAPNGITWVEDWLEECGDDCSVDFIALHWYGTDSEAFISYLEKFHDTFDKPLWITEWACHDFSSNRDHCDEDEIIEFMNTTQTFMDQAEWVERYAWFGAMPEPVVAEVNSIMDEDGDINELGLQYIGSESPEIPPKNDNNDDNRSGFPGIRSYGAPAATLPIGFATLGRATAMLAVVVTASIYYYL